MNHLPYRVEEQLPGETTWRIVTSFATPERAETSTFRVKKHVDFEAST